MGNRMAEELATQDPQRHSTPVTHNGGALRIVGLYTLVGGLWILFSDRAAEAIVGSPSALTTVSTFKGWGYVVVTALLLYALIRRYTATLRAGEERYRSLSADLQIANQHLSQALAHEQAARRDVEATNQEIEAFNYTVSHDLRAPLNLIRQFARLLLDQYNSALPDQGQQYLQQILAHAVTTDCMAEDLLTLSRATRLSPQKQTVDMRRLVAKVVEATKAAHPERQVEIQIDELPAAEADPLLLNQVWGALLSNALKFTRTRGLARVQVSALPGDASPVYFIKDNGVGFDMAQSDRLFRAFQHLHAPEDYPGTGVGLTVVEHIIRRHGGRVWASAEVDRGATFFFTLGT
jgi:light-regulated signal transduction histidine kinase (bacteriophytochrome)